MEDDTVVSFLFQQLFVSWVKAKLSPIASRSLMKLLFAARMARFDLLRAVQGLAPRNTKWSVDCDKALHCLMCYVQCTLDDKMSGFVGESR